MINLIKPMLNYVDHLRIKKLSSSLVNLMSRQDYVHGLGWFGIPIFQTPTDLYIYQEIIFKVKPRVIVETGVAKGGSVLYACHLLDLIHRNNSEKSWRVISCDVNSMRDAREAVATFGYADKVDFFQGDSASLEFKIYAKSIIDSLNDPVVLISLDSNHTESHVKDELESLADFVSKGSYAIIWDSRIGDLTVLTHWIRPRAWNRRHHAGTGASLFMKETGISLGFVSDLSFEDRLQISGLKNGILFRKSTKGISND